MPSQLYTNEAISFICARDFTWDGQEYKMGEDFDQDIATGRLELLVRTRRIIPVVDSYEDKPRHWHREVRLREHVEQKLGVSPSVRTPLDQAEGDKTEGLGYDPSEHTIDEVMEYVEENPDEVLSVYALEEQGKDRSTLKAKLDEILNQQAEEENEQENTDV